MLSNLTKGFQGFEDARVKYHDAPWFSAVHGNYTYRMLPLSVEALKANRASFVLGTPWRYDPMATLQASKTPQLWVLGEDDLLAPSAETARPILALRDAGHDFTLAMFPHAGHGVMEYEPFGAGGARRNPSGGGL